MTDTRLENVWDSPTNLGNQITSLSFNQMTILPQFPIIEVSRRKIKGLGTGKSRFISFYVSVSIIFIGLIIENFIMCIKYWFFWWNWVDNIKVTKYFFFESATSWKWPRHNGKPSWPDILWIQWLNPDKPLFDLGQRYSPNTHRRLRNRGRNTNCVLNNRKRE